MRSSTSLAAHRDAVRTIVLDHGVVNPRVFGSAARGTDSADSDFHLVVDPSPETTLFDIGAIWSELLEVPVDVVTPTALPPSFGSRVLAEASASVNKPRLGEYLDLLELPDSRRRVAY